ncbi:MAG: hypothetical protein R3305_01625 [Gammaproteobacteria bacterium]|nr:hypothetical protein [Gammaproteobacteria bacterium]
MLAMSPAALADASSGIFAILDEVVLEPSDLEPDRVRLLGVFIVPQPVSSGLHQPPQRGELYFSLNPDDRDGSRADWHALAATAGTGQPVGFGEYWVQTDPPPTLRQVPPNASFNTSLVVTIATGSRPVVPEPYPRPNSRGVTTTFDADFQLCPRFGDSSSEIIARLLQAHDPERPLPALPVCEEAIGLIDNSDLDSVFREQARDEVWAAEAEALLARRVIDSGVELTQMTIECRYTICHAGFVYPSASYRSATGIGLTNSALRDVPGFDGGGKVEDSPSGAPTRDYWIQRRDPAVGGP